MFNPLTEVGTTSILKVCKGENPRCSCNYCDKKKSIMKLGFSEESVTKFMEETYGR